MRIAKTPIRLEGCQGWSESSLGTHAILLAFTWCGSIMLGRLGPRGRSRPFWAHSEPHQDKTNKVVCAPSEDSDQPGIPPSLIRVFAVHLKKAWVLSYPLSEKQRHWSDWADAQADLSLWWAHMPFCWFCHDAAHSSAEVLFEQRCIDH